MRTKLFKAGIVFAVAAWLVFTLAAQQGEERRRADNAPIELPGGCRVEFKAFRSESLGTEQRYSIFLGVALLDSGLCYDWPMR
jgi:hypothetical protein